MGANPPHQPSDASGPMSLAPRWHTASLVAVIVAVATTGALLATRGSGTPSPPPGVSRVVAVYLPMIVVQWCLTIYVCRVGRPRSALRSLLGKGVTTVGRGAVDVALAAAGWLLVNAIELLWATGVGSSASGAVAAVLPRSWPERLAWVGVAVSAGFCEEVVYRGYLQTQLTAFTGRPAVAIVLQAVLFGVAHGEQGGAAVFRLTVYGLALGVLARWRTSLVAGILCHVAIDLVSGLARP